MRVLATTTGGTGHFGPMVPLLQACVHAGHEVLVACPGSFAGQVERTGLACAPFDDAPAEEMGAVFTGLQGASYEEGNRVVISAVFAGLDTDAALPRLDATFRRWRPDVVVRDPAEFAGWILAERDGVPQVRVAISLLSWETGIARIAAPALAAAAERNGLTPDADGRRLLHGPVIVAAPAGFDPPAGLEPQSVHRYGGPLPLSPQEAARVPRGDEPLVYVTFGTVAASVGLWPAAYAAAIDALADAPVRVLVTTGFGVDPSALGRLPSNVAVADFVPQDEVLAHTSVMVTHGGYGSVLGGLRAGVPMVVIPMFADQADNARRVAAVGAGVNAQRSPDPMDLSPGLDVAIRTAVDGVLGNEEVRAVARELSREMASQPPAESLVEVVAATARA